MIRNSKPPYPSASLLSSVERSDTLGINAESSSVSTDIPLKSKLQLLRRERYGLGNTARAIYAKEGERLGYDYVLNFHRTAHCCYTAFGDVRLMKSVQHNKASFKGVVACGNSWTCPTCSARIQERRRLEISRCMDYFYNEVPNKQACMVTLTFSHKFGDDLRSLLAKQSIAFKKLRSGDVWKRFKEIFGFSGLIRSLEVTYGTNGYHPHTHELWFIDKNIDRDRLVAYLMYKFRAKKHHVYRDHLLTLDEISIFKELLITRWAQCCEKAGLMDDVDLASFLEHSVDVKPNVSNSDYLAKQDDSRHWGADREIAKGSTKEGRKKGLHPFSFLLKFSDSGDGVWASRWLDYSSSFKNKAQIYWSSGLKKLVGVDELTDEQISDLTEDDAIIILQLDYELWLKVRTNKKQSNILDLIEDSSNSNTILNYVNSLSHPLIDYSIRLAHKPPIPEDNDI